MAQINVNPTRMELTRLKTRLRTAQRGHKLLRDKRDELMRRFLAQVELARRLRAETEEGLSGVYEAMDRAAAALPPEFLAGVLLCPREGAALAVSMRTAMGVAVPVFEVAALQRGVRPYGYVQTDASLDEALDRLEGVFTQMLELAGAEKTVHLMAREIESTRRRVNALEYRLIPELHAAIRRISMKLEENERGNIVRLMKVKELVLADARRQRREAAPSDA